MTRSLQKRSQHRVLSHLAVSSLFLIAGLGTTRILLHLQQNADGRLFGLSRAPATSEESDADTSIANVNYTPEQVVALQIQSIREAESEPERMRTCYSLASPNNRAMTGPLEHFAELVVAPPYDHLAGAVDWQIGQATVSEGHAVVLVSVTTVNDVHAYRFLLSQQIAPPYTDCWMTDGVEPITFESFSKVTADSAGIDEGAGGE